MVGVWGRVLAALVCPAFFAGAFGLPRSFATLVGVGGAGSVDWVSGASPVPRARLGLPVSSFPIVVDSLDLVGGWLGWVSGNDSVSGLPWASIYSALCLHFYSIKP